MRRSALSVAICVLVVTLMVLVALLALMARTEAVSESRFCMDTVCTITAYGPKSRAKAAISEVWNKVTELENLISATLPYSDISRLNASAGSDGWLVISPQTYDALEFALSMGKRTDGALNCAMGAVISLWAIGTDSARVPKQSEIDGLLPFCNADNVLLRKEGDSFQARITDCRTQINLGAVGKGIAADLARSILKEHGVNDAMVDFGGNLYVLGSMPTMLGSRPFKIGLQDPDGSRGGYYTAIRVKDVSVVTSGSYERRLVADDGNVYSHIIDPNTGWSIEGDIFSVSVIGPSSSVCDALSTSFFVMGPEKAASLLDGDFGAYMAVFLVSEGDGRAVIRVGNQDVLQ